MISRPVIAWMAMVAVSFGMAGCKSSGAHDTTTPVSKTQPQAKGPVNYMPQQNMAMNPVPTNGVPAQASWNTVPQQRLPMAQGMQPDAVGPANRSAYGASQVVSQPMQPMYTQNPGAVIRQVPNTMAADPSANMGNGYSNGVQMIPANAAAGSVNRASVPADYQPRQPLQISAPAYPGEAQQQQPRGPEGTPVDNGMGAMEPTGPAMSPAPDAMAR